MESSPFLEGVACRVVRCMRCVRLRRWSWRVAREKRRQFRQWTYWGKPVPGFGDPGAKVWVIGLAPAAHGANRTGRMFTGDRSGQWLYRVLAVAGFTDGGRSVSASHSDGLRLRRVYVSAIVRCAPPGNRPAVAEQRACAWYLLQEAFQLFSTLRVVVVLGGLAYAWTRRVLFPDLPRGFRHGQEGWATLLGGHPCWRGKKVRVVASYHPSQQNTFTGRLTWQMWEAIFLRVRAYLHQERGWEQEMGGGP